MKRILAWLLAISLMAVTAINAQTEVPRVKFETSKGVILIELNPGAAPKTTDNFIFYVKNGFYDNTIFHRVIKGFMIQGGGLGTNMQQKPTQPPIPNEADNTLKNVTGTIAMARTSAPHSATSQFFINTVDNPFLDFKAKTGAGWGYCVFGHVVEGMEVVRDIEEAPTTIKAGHRDVPIEAVIITKATIVTQPSPAEATPKQEKILNTHQAK